MSKIDVVIGDRPATARPQHRDRFAGPAAVPLLRRWIARRRSRIALGALDDRLLHDVGIDPVAAIAEARKPFWRK